MSTNDDDYKILMINGPISLVPVEPKDVKGKDLWVYILMGPTGAGKSAFIEALSPSQNLDISKDSLDSVTQVVTCYRVVNVVNGAHYIYAVMDTPGFLDTSLSESRIITMIEEKLGGIRQATERLAVSLLYFQPITDIRMGGSKRGAVKVLRAFAKSFNATGLSVVTTMWNCILTPKQIDDASRRLESLKNEVFTNSPLPNIMITKFEFSRCSALTVLDEPYGGWFFESNSRRLDSEYQSSIRDSLIQRIANLQQRLRVLADDKRDMMTHGDECGELVELLEAQERAALDDLQSFSYDLCVLDPEAYQPLSRSPFPSTSSITALCSPIFLVLS
ncbi:hypothetical protein BJ165DRAFT_1529915 [Panaeolus papilionaceus]|nr:hypothetical protein BJ165DRAFT_1529915 [Panaeolus papilionaceus]